MLLSGKFEHLCYYHCFYHDPFPVKSMAHGTHSVVNAPHTRVVRGPLAVGTRVCREPAETAPGFAGADHPSPNTHIAPGSACLLLQIPLELLVYNFVPNFFFITSVSIAY